MSIDDEAIDRLVAAAQTGDPEAFGGLFDRYYVPVYRFVVDAAPKPDHTPKADPSANSGSRGNGTDPSAAPSASPSVP